MGDLSEYITPLKIISSWKHYVKLIARAVSMVIPEAEAYLTGGVVEDRLTVLSDIDILIVLPHKPGFKEAVELRAKILEEAEKLGLPLYAPIELHIIGREELTRYTRKGKIMKISLS